MKPLRIADDNGVLLTLHVQPGAKRTEWAGLHGDAIKIRLAAPPVEGKANACLLAFVAAYFGVPKANTRLVSGDSSRQKLVRVVEAPDERIKALQASLGLLD